jgi:cytochrome c biogenesis protein ResB
VRRIAAAASSLKLTAILIVYLTIACLVATLLPQGAGPQLYYARFPAPLAAILLFLGYEHFFRSAIFLAPLGLFFLNLAACSIRRLEREISGAIPRRYGPDLIHFGLILLFIGALLSSADRESGVAQLAVGDRIELPGAAVLSLVAFTSEKYVDGRPKEWTSTVEIRRDGDLAIASFPIRVNHPLTYRGISIYQMSHGIEDTLLVRAPEGGEKALGPGEEMDTASGKLEVAEVGADEARVDFTGSGGKREERVKAGDGIGGFAILGIRPIEVSGLLMVRDRFFALVAAALAFMVAGLGLSFARAFKEALG